MTTGKRSFSRSCVRLIALNQFTNEEILKKLRRAFPALSSSHDLHAVAWHRTKMNNGTLPFLGYGDYLSYNERYRAVRGASDGRRKNGWYKKKGHKKLPTILHRKPTEDKK